MDIERHTDKDPKRFTTFLDVEKQLRFFFDDEWKNLIVDVQNDDTEIKFAKSLTTELLWKFVSDYISQIDLTMSVEERFVQLKEIWKKHGFAGNNKEFKEWWYVWKVWELAMFLRVALCASKKTPDLFSVMKVLGMERIVARLDWTVQHI